MCDSKSSKREREELFKIQQERERGVTQNPAREREGKESAREWEEKSNIDSESVRVRACVDQHSCLSLVYALYIIIYPSVSDRE